MARVGIIGALAAEVDHLIAHLEGATRTVYAGRTFVTGRLSGQEAVVVQSGIGKVAAAITAQLLIDRFGVDALINTGMAGGLDRRLAIKDVVVSTGALQHDFDLTAFGHTRGYLYGPQDSVPTLFAADQSLVERAVAAARAVLPAGSKVLCGTVASGDIFVADDALKAAIRDTFGAAATEMEGAAIAQTAAENGVPFVLLRTISDLAEQHAYADFSEMEAYAGELAGAITSALLAHT